MKSTKKRSSFSMQETDEAEEENEDLSDRQKQIREGGAGRYQKPKAHHPVPHRHRTD